MRCHYEVLEISLTADTAEIKKAYRKFALKWHPDKNLDNVDKAKLQFQLVQQAYEILSDPQERAWYDKHRENILAERNSDCEDKGVDVFKFFTTTCFKEYNDDEKGFYTVYNKLFKDLVQEEVEAMGKKEQFFDIPEFGNSKSIFEEVVKPFYDYWDTYSTRKTFAWLDPYSMNDTRDRRTLKILDKENKKVRQKAKKERNELIRNLVAFVKKRDKRVEEHSKLVDAKRLENRLKHEELSYKKRLERNQELNNSGAQAEWARFANVQSELEEIEKHLTKEFGDDISEEEEEEQDLSDLYCVACNKLFKTYKALNNHEASKKHKENLEFLKETMLEEEEAMAEDDEVTPDEESCSEEEVLINQRNKSNGIKSQDSALVSENVNEENRINNEVDDFEEDPISSDEEIFTKKQKKKAKKSKVLRLEEVHEQQEHFKPVLSDDDNFNTIKKKTNKKNHRKSKAADIRNIENKEHQPEVKDINSKTKLIKKEKLEPDDDIDTDHTCITCNSNFPSKNKLFDHLKKTGHGVLLGGKNNKNKKNVNRK